MNPRPPALPHPCLPSPWFEEPDPSLDRLPTWPDDPSPPVIWSIAGHDSGGGAGLSADARAAAAFGVHLCPVVAAVTAQNSQGVRGVHALPPGPLTEQLEALRQDLTPRVIKTGLLASVHAVEAVLALLEQLRALWHGHEIAVSVCHQAPAAGVDTAEDLQRVRLQIER